MAPQQMAPFTHDIEPPDPAGDNLAQLMDDRYDVLAVPGPLPISRSSRLVVAIPKDATPAPAKAKDGTIQHNQQQKELRASLIAAFLSAGFRVKDAGIMELPSFSVRTHPGADRKKTVTETTQDADGATRKTVETQSRSDWWHSWWSSEGLKILLEDPTSLWVTDLLSYDQLRADVFFRIFSVSVQSGSTQADVEFHYTDEQLAEYRARVADAKTIASRWDDKRLTFATALERYGADYDRYLRDHVQWQKENLRAHTQQKLVVPRAQPRAPVQVPDPAPAYTEEELRRNVAAKQERVNLDRLRVRILAELVNASRGAVVWVGNVVGETSFASSREPSHAALFRVMSGMVRAMLNK